MAWKKLPYKEGDWFAVPLREGGYALGLVARIGTRGGIVLGYFFGPKKNVIPSQEDTFGLAPTDAVLVGHFCDPGLMNGTWPIIDRSENWHRTEWSQTKFSHIDVVDSRKAYLRQYDDNDPFTCIQDIPISLAEAQQLPQDGLDGHIALQIRLSRLLKI